MGGHKVQGRQHGQRRRPVGAPARRRPRRGGRRRVRPSCSRACRATSPPRSPRSCRSRPSASAPGRTATVRCSCCTTCSACPAPRFKFTKQPTATSRSEVVRAVTAYARRGPHRRRARTTPTASTRPACSISRRPPRRGAWSGGERAAGHAVALVPTMGALHAGHLRLVEVAHEPATGSSCRSSSTRSSSTAATTSTTTRARSTTTRPRCAEAGVDALYLPDVGDMYPPGFQTHVEPGPLAEPLCGAGRPGHFRGVTTVVTQAVPRRAPERRRLRPEGLPAARHHPPDDRRPRLRHRDRRRARPFASPTAWPCRAATSC